MRYDNMFWVLMAPAFASCACFAFEMSCNFAESWNNRFEELRRGFDMLGPQSETREYSRIFSPGVGDKHAELAVSVAEQKRRR